MPIPYVLGAFVLGILVIILILWALGVIPPETVWLMGQ